MSKYFSYFPKTIYNLDNSNSLDAVTNLMNGFSFDESLTENSILYYEYTVADGETPEMLAHKIYGSVEKHWVILKLNGVVDVKTDWPLSQKNLMEVINDKYANNGILTAQTGYQWAFNTTHSYYKIETRTLVASGEKVVDTIEIDANTYANVVTTSVQYTLPDNNVLQIDTTRNLKTYYQYEVDLNESKRSIKVLKPEFVPSVTDEFVRVISNG